MDFPLFLAIVGAFCVSWWIVEVIVWLDTPKK